MSDRGEWSQLVMAFLRAAEVPEDEIQRAADEGWLLARGAEVILLPAGPRYNLAEVAAMAGVDADSVRRLWRAMGFPDPPPGDLPFSQADIDLVKILRAGDSSISDGAIQETRVIASAMARAADVIVDEVSAMYEEQGLDTEEVFEQVATNFDLDRIERLLLLIYRRQLLATARRRLVTTSTGSERSLGFGFADVVGFTRLSHQLASLELGRVVKGFHSAAYDAVTGAGGRVVKTLGDSVMFVVDHLPDLVSVGCDLTDAAPAGEGLGLHVGLAWGPAITREGDYFGPAVNLASRVAAAAPAGLVVAPDDVRQELARDPGFDWRSLGPTPLKDFGDVDLWSVTRAGGETP